MSNIYEKLTYDLKNSNLYNFKVIYRIRVHEDQNFVYFPERRVNAHRQRKKSQKIPEKK